MYQAFGLFIDGKWRDASDGGTAPVMSPVTERPIGEAPVATHADTDDALNSAARGFSSWKSKSAFERADTLHAIADEMTRHGEEAARMISTETGKPRNRSANGGSPPTNSVGTPGSEPDLWPHRRMTRAMRPFRSAA
jgi:acyl-CoA reductase-like NAD-dependent aldehyde dehydrogenase